MLIMVFKGFSCKAHTETKYRLIAKIDFKIYAKYVLNGLKKIFLLNLEMTKYIT